MNIAPRHRDFAIARLAAGAFVVIAADSLGAARWDSTLTDLVRLESLGPASLIAGASGAWVIYAPTLSVDCSPPRGCFAKTQRIHYDFRCAPRYAFLTERISMDLNGTVVNHEVRDPATSYTPSYDAGAVWILNTFCPLPNRD